MPAEFIDTRLTQSTTGSCASVSKTKTNSKTLKKWYTLKHSQPKRMSEWLFKEKETIPTSHRESLVTKDTRHSNISDLRDFLLQTKIKPEVVGFEKSINKQTLVKVNWDKRLSQKSPKTIQITDIQSSNSVKVSNLFANPFNSSKDVFETKPPVSRDSGGLFYVCNIEGSQEKTIIDFMNATTEKTIIREEHTFNTFDSIEPSVADEIEYSSQFDTTDDLELVQATLDVYEGTDEHNINLINTLKASWIGSVSNLHSTWSVSKFQDHFNHSIRPRTTHSQYSSKPISGRTGSTLKHINIKKDASIVFQNNQIESKLENPLVTSSQQAVENIGKIKPTLNLKTTSKRWARTRLFSNKFNNK